MMLTHDEKMLDDHNKYRIPCIFLQPHGFDHVCIWLPCQWRPLTQCNWLVSQWRPATWSRDLKVSVFITTEPHIAGLCIKCIQHVLFITTPLPDMPWGPLLILICQPTLNSMLMGLCPGIYYSMKAVCGRSHKHSPASWSHKSYNPHPPVWKILF